MSIHDPDITLVEVGPRDGLQNETQTVSVETKLIFIQKLMDAGLRTIEASSFVSPRWIPQLADHEALVSRLPFDQKNMRFPVLIPNQTGLDRALKYPIRDIAVFASATESFSKKNINCTIEESLARFRDITAQALEQGIRVRGYVSCTLGCPYEGKVPIPQVVSVAKALYEAGCAEISLGDTIGVGTPYQAANLIKAVATEIPLKQLAVHFHDTYGQALANIFACVQEGIRIIDSAVAGLGGCPYAKGASGNVATEEVVYMLAGMGFKTGVDLTKLIEAGNYISQYLKRRNGSKVAIALGHS